MQRSEIQDSNEIIEWQSPGFRYAAASGLRLLFSAAATGPTGALVSKRVHAKIWGGRVKQLRRPARLPKIYRARRFKLLKSNFALGTRTLKQCVITRPICTQCSYVLIEVAQARFFLFSKNNTSLNPLISHQSGIASDPMIYTALIFLRPAQIGATIA